MAGMSGLKRALWDIIRFHINCNLPLPFPLIWYFQMTILYQITTTCCNNMLLITTYQTEAKLDSTHVSDICDNTELENVNSNKLLSVIIDKILTWKFHIDKTAKSICCNIVLLRRIRKYLLHQTRITFYKSYIQPHIDYCNTVWGQSPHANRIHIPPKMVLRLIMNVPKLTHSAPLCHQCGVMPIQNRVKFPSNSDHSL